MRQAIILDQHMSPVVFSPQAYLSNSLYLAYRNIFKCGVNAEGLFFLVTRFIEISLEAVTYFYLSGITFTPSKPFIIKSGPGPLKILKGGHLFHRTTVIQKYNEEAILRHFSYF